MLVKLKDKSSVELPDSYTAKDLAEKFNLKEPNQAIAVLINGNPYDLNTPLNHNDEVIFLDFEDYQGKEIFWHTSAHILAQAVLRLWPNTKVTIGPPIENGFYYDFANLTISDSDFKTIEQEMKTIIKENKPPEKKIIPSKAEALSIFPNNEYKQELIESLNADDVITVYHHGDFYDLCRGPHISNISKIKAIKILKTSGAYWHADSDNEMLTRIYGITFPDKKMMKDYLFQLEEAKKRDHKIIGKKLDLFSINEAAPGMPLIHPKGMIIWNNLINYWHECHTRANYVEIKTPTIMTRALWEISGHWDVYRDNMYTLKIDDRDYAIKPMNCPGCMLYYRTHSHSYKELPIRIAEIGNVHRHEPSGAVSGLFRVKCFYQDDAHIFIQPENTEDEILNILSLVDEIYSTFGLDYHLELSTRPEKETIGSDKDWEIATKSLENALDRLNCNYSINKGDGAFYGPKIDCHILDSLKRTWQCGTIQVDLALPERFQLEYTDKLGERKRPTTIHRTIYGSIERFMGILIEHFAGRFPLWLSPLQVRIVCIADRHVNYGIQVKDKFVKSGFLCDLDDSHESVNKKVRNAQLNQINYILIIGDREMENKTVSLRTRDNVVHGEVNIDDLIQKLEQELFHRDLASSI